jgi:hypothetical protein
MDELPAVLQKEIWEYVRGDRSFWKSKMDQVLPKLHFGELRILKISRPIGNATIRLLQGDESECPFRVFLCQKDEFRFHCSFRGDNWFQIKEDAMVCFNAAVPNLKAGPFWNNFQIP